LSPAVTNCVGAVVLLTVAVELTVIELTMSLLRALSKQPVISHG
jgi:hypothetical protein